jgi:DNA-binding transcriptional ArsR family regulator
VTTEAEPEVVFDSSDLGALLGLGRYLEGHAEAVLPGAEQPDPIPEQVYRALARVVEALREGKPITVRPRSERLGTQEIADFLGVTRAALVQHLSAGKILYEQQSRKHRRVLFTDFRRYVSQRREERVPLADLMGPDDNTDDDLYGVRQENYAAALEKARIQRGHFDRPEGP